MDDSDRKLYVGGIFRTVGCDELRKIFSKFGEIKAFYKSPSVPFTFAFVTYKSSEQANNAIYKLNGTFLHGFRLKVNLSSDKDKDFLANISAESCSSCSEDECCLNKENGTQKKSFAENEDSLNLPKSKCKKHNQSRSESLKRNNSLPNTQYNPRKKVYSFERTDLSNKSLFSTNSSNSLKRSDSLKTASSNKLDDSAKSTKISKKKSSKRYFDQQINPDLSSYLVSQIESDNNQRTTVKDSFNNAKAKRPTHHSNPFNNQNNFPFKFSSESINQQEIINPFFPMVNLFSKNINDFKVSKRILNINEPNPFRNNRFQIDKNLIESNLFKKNRNPSSGFLTKIDLIELDKNPFKVPSNKDNDSIDANKSLFKIDTSVFGFDKNSFLIDKNPINHGNKSKEQIKERELVVIDSPIVAKIGNTILFSDADIDERLNKSIEVITLD